MTGFCGNCGNQLGETDKVCGNCGTPVQGKAPIVTDVAVDNQKSEKKIGGNKRIKLVAVAIVAIVAIVIISNLISNNTGYNGTIKKMVKAFEKYDMTTLQGLTSEISDEKYGMWYGDELENYYEDRVSDALDNIEERVGTIKSISYEITDTTEFSERRLDKLKDELVDTYEMYVDDIKEIIQVDLKLTVKGSKKSSSYNVDKLWLIKESSGWKLLYGDLNY